MSTPASLEIQVRSEEVKLAEQRLRQLSVAGEGTEDAVSGLQRKLSQLEVIMNRLSKAIKSAEGTTRANSEAYIAQVQDLTKLTRTYNSAANAVKRFKNSQAETRRDMAQMTMQINKMSQSLNSARNIFFALQVGQMFKQFVNVGVQMDKIRSILTAVFEDQRTVGREMAYVQNQAKRLGRDLFSLAEAYAQFSAAAKGANITAAQQKEIFEAIAETATVMQFDIENTRGVIRAFEQMMSKGKVQAEELRLQLGDRLPGAFSLFVRAFYGTTEATTELRSEFDKLMKQGKILSADLLPKVAKELRRTFGGSGLDMAMKTAQAQMNRARNSLYILMTTGWESGIEDSIKNMSIAFAKFFESPFVTKAIKALGSGMKVVTGWFLEFHDTILKIVLAMTTLVTVFTALKVMMAGMSFLKAITTSPAGLLSIAATGAAFTGIMMAISSLNKAEEKPGMASPGGFGGSAAGMLLPFSPLQMAVTQEFTDSIAMATFNVNDMNEAFQGLTGWIGSVADALAQLPGIVSFIVGAAGVGLVGKPISKWIASKKEAGFAAETTRLEAMSRDRAAKEAEVNQLAKEFEMRTRTAMISKYQTQFQEQFGGKSDVEVARDTAQTKEAERRLFERFNADKLAEGKTGKIYGPGTGKLIVLPMSDFTAEEILRLQKINSDVTRTEVANKSKQKLRYMMPQYGMEDLHMQGKIFNSFEEWEKAVNNLSEADRKVVASRSGSGWLNDAQLGEVLKRNAEQDRKIADNGGRQPGINKALGMTGHSGIGKPDPFIGSIFEDGAKGRQLVFSDMEHFKMTMIRLEEEMNGTTDAVAASAQQRDRTLTASQKSAFDRAFSTNLKVNEGAGSVSDVVYKDAGIAKELGSTGNGNLARKALGQLRTQFEDDLSDAVLLEKNRLRSAAGLDKPVSNDPWNGRPVGRALNAVGAGGIYSPFTTEYDSRTHARGGFASPQGSFGGDLVAGKERTAAGMRRFGGLFTGESTGAMGGALSTPYRLMNPEKYDAKQALLNGRAGPGGATGAELAKMAGGLGKTSRLITGLSTGFGALYAGVSRVGAFFGGPFLFGLMALGGALSFALGAYQKSKAKRTYTEDELSYTRSLQMKYGEEKGFRNPNATAGEEFSTQYEDMQSALGERKTAAEAASKRNKEVSAGIQSQINAVINQPNYDASLPNKYLDGLESRLKANKTAAMLYKYELDDVAKSMSDLGKDVEDTKNKMKNFIMPSPGEMTALSDLIGDLEDDIATTGMSESEKKIYKLDQDWKKHQARGSFMGIPIMPVDPAYTSAIEEARNLSGTERDIKATGIGSMYDAKDKLDQSSDPGGYARKKLQNQIDRMRELLTGTMPEAELASKLEKYRAEGMEDIANNLAKEGKTDKITQKYLELLKVISPVKAAQQELNAEIKEFKDILGKKMTPEQEAAYRAVKNRAIEDARTAPMRGMTEGPYSGKSQRASIMRDAEEMRNEALLNGYSSQESAGASIGYVQKKLKDLNQSYEDAEIQTQGMVRSNNELRRSLQAIWATPEQQAVLEYANKVADVEAQIQEITRAANQQMSEDPEASARIRANMQAQIDALREQLGLEKQISAEQQRRSNMSDFASKMESLGPAQDKINNGYDDVGAYGDSINRAFENGSISARTYATEMRRVTDAYMELGIAQAELNMQMGNGSFADGMISSVGRWAQEAENATARVGTAFGNTFTTLIDGAADAFGRLIVYGGDWGDALMEVANSAIAELISSMIKLGIQMLVNQVMGNTAATAATAASVAQAQIIATAWAAAAAEVSLVSFGANSGPAIAGMAAAHAASGAMAIAGFADGGAVKGPGTGRSDSIMARLSNGEYVINAASTSRYFDILEQINGNKFADGGYVGSAPTPPARSFGGGGGNQFNISVNVESKSTGDANADARAANMNAQSTKRAIKSAVREVLAGEARQGGMLSKRG